MSGIILFLPFDYMEWIDDLLSRLLLSPLPQSISIKESMYIIIVCII
ncbi:hypothetical protein [Cytobacillus purgationiresistens]|uniref:Uncharacterized protein n=1 Tax=Cytobacillus purgationiresistens TaxID=863449 RepID=A0ABU0AGV0_9BACI|nr:hypothetical protein [Cytobacillus purgationiresistens]MDQ0270094.1 hypothetical protein [Cytobacillus purgationiresistens]